jgi:hypothetical protein
LTDFDYHSVDDIDDANDESLHVLIKDNTTGAYGWHWIYRETLADYGRHDLVEYGMAGEDAE